MTTAREMAWRLYQACAETARDAQIVADRAARDKEAAADLHDLLVQLETNRTRTGSIGPDGKVRPMWPVHGEATGGNAS